MKELIPFVVALIVVINPIGMLPVFYGLTDHLTTPERKRTARLTSFTIAVVLILSLLGGTAILRFFGIDIDSFRVGGGIYLLLLGLKMLRVESNGTKQTGSEIQENSGVAIVPLGMPILAGPATISTAVLYAQQAKSTQMMFTLVLGSVIASVLVWIILHIAGFFQDKMNPLVLTSISRIMGLLLTSLAVKFITVGLSRLLPGLLGTA
ncbi:MAG: MarC family protein [Thermoguttaceae bacterium]|nr:MarC family protein [Thermoguttaceae bacterium]